MNTNLTNFTNLVRLGIGHQASLLTEPVDWDAIEVLAKRHGLLGVVYDGVNHLAEIAENAEILPLTVKLRWMGKVMQGYEQRYALYRKAVVDLTAWYHAHGYRMMLLKGLACGLDWPRPEHRPYGDIDIYLFGQYKEADAALSHELGIKIDNSHHHHTVFQWQGFTVENHYDFVNVHVHRSSRELEGLFKEIAGQARNEEVPANLHALFLIRHIMSHFTGASMSLRQVLDWGFFVKAHGEEVDWKWLVEVLEKYHMREFFECVNAICVYDLGFQDSCFKFQGSLRSKSQENPIENLSTNNSQLTTDSKLYTLNSQLKQRVLNDTLSPEFSEETPKHVWKRVPFKYRRWKANRWKRELCYDDSQWNSFLGGVWNHLLKPAGI